MSRTDVERMLPMIDRVTADLDRLAFLAALNDTADAIARRIERAQADMVACRQLVNLELR